MRTVLLFIMALATTGCGMGMDAWIHDDVNEDFTQQAFSQRALREDLAYLQTQMALRHPVFHELTDEKAINEKFAAMNSKINGDMSRSEYFRLIATVNPYFRDGHSLVFPLLAEGTYAEDKGLDLFPFGVFTQNQSLYINKSYNNKSTGEVIEKGTKVVSINGVTGEAILTQLAEYGHGETANLRMHMSTLLFHYWLNAIYEWRGDFTLVLEHDKQQKNIVVSNHENWQSERNKLGDNWLEVMPEQTAYLKLGTFDVDEDSGFDGFVEDAFAKIKKEKLLKLIIDVRGNTGGQSDAGAEVIRYLTDKNLNQASSAIEKLSNDNNGLFGYKGEPGEVIELDVVDSQIIEPVDAAKRFTGEVVVLIDEMTYSAGIVFAATIQDHKVAKLVGQPTGGHANQTGNLTPFYLPNTKLLILAPSRYMTRVSGNTSKQSIQPDVHVDKGQDATLDITLQISQELFSN